MPINMVIEFKKGEGMHEEYQNWRSQHSNCYIIAVRSKTNSMLHTNKCTNHLGKPDVEEHRVGWGSFGNADKVCSASKEELVSWANLKLNGNLKECKHCKP